MTDYGHEEDVLPKPASLVVRFVSGPADAVSVYAEDEAGYYPVVDSDAETAVLRARTRELSDALLIASCLD